MVVLKEKPHSVLMVIRLAEAKAEVQNKKIFVSLSLDQEIPRRSSTLLLWKFLPLANEREWAKFKLADVAFTVSSPHDLSAVAVVHLVEQIFQAYKLNDSLLELLSNMETIFCRLLFNLEGKMSIKVATKTEDLDEVKMHH